VQNASNCAQFALVHYWKQRKARKEGEIFAAFHKQFTAVLARAPVRADLGRYPGKIYR
jgi:hypothetical protein